MASGLTLLKIRILQITLCRDFERWCQRRRAREEWQWIIFSPNRPRRGADFGEVERRMGSLGVMGGVEAVVAAVGISEDEGEDAEGEEGKEVEEVVVGCGVGRRR